jgi:uncharacterized protein YcfJ
MFKTLTLAIAATGLVATTSIPQDAAARTRHHTTRHHHHYTRKSCRTSANTGTAIGAIAGGALGYNTGNHGTGSTLLGAGLGGLAGHQIAKSHCKRVKARR